MSSVTSYANVIKGVQPTEHPISSGKPINENSKKNKGNNNNNVNLNNNIVNLSDSNNIDNKEFPLPNSDLLASSYNLSGKNLADLQKQCLSEETTVNILTDVTSRFAKLNQRLNSQITTIINMFKNSNSQDKERDLVKFADLQNSYNDMFISAKSIEKNVAKEIEALQTAITNDKRFSENDLTHIVHSDICTKAEALQKENEYFVHQRNCKLTLTSLSGEWAGLIEGIEKAYSRLLWLEVLTNKPENISYETFEGEYKAGCHKPKDTQTLPHLPLMRLPDSTPLKSRLTDLRDKASKVSEYAAHLLVSSQSNLKKNVETTKTDTLRVAADFLTVSAGIEERQKEVEAYFKKLEDELKKGRCKILNTSALESLAQYEAYGVKLASVKNAEMAHLKVQNEKEITLRDCQEIWNTTIEKIESACAKINEVVVLVTKATNETFIEALKFKLDSNQVAPHALTLQERVTSIKAELDAHLKEINAANDVARNNRTMWGGIADEATGAKVRESYKTLYTKYIDITTRGAEIQTQINEALTKSGEKIQKMTVPELPSQLKEFLTSLGTAQNHKDDYMNLANDLADEKNKIEKKHKKEQIKFGTLKNLQREYEDSHAQVNTRLCRLAQAFKLGYLPREAGNNLSSMVGGASVPKYEKVPAPDALTEGVLVGSVNM